ncbi:MAG: hypothetical protein QW688_00795 [Thermoprotei archaeon]
MIEALSDKHSQLDVRLQNVVLRMPGSRLGLEINGAISFAVHMRDLSDEEKQAHIAKNMAALQVAHMLILQL